MTFLIDKSGRRFLASKDLVNRSDMTIVSEPTVTAIPPSPEKNEDVEVEKKTPAKNTLKKTAATVEESNQKQVSSSVSSSETEALIDEWDK